MNAKDLEKIRFLVVDVDGTLTDSGVYYDDNGNELKKFSTKDGAGFFAAREAGIEIIVLTGRECAATTRRMKEMKVTELYQKVLRKKEFLEDYMKDRGIGKEEIGYIGDDVNDLLPMSLCGFVGCPADSNREILERADYVSTEKGGHGAMRDVIEYILRERGIWDDIVQKIYGGI